MNTDAPHKARCRADEVNAFLARLDAFLGYDGPQSEAHIPTRISRTTGGCYKIKR